MLTRIHMHVTCIKILFMTQITMLIYKKKGKKLQLMVILSILSSVERTYDYRQLAGSSSHARFYIACKSIFF